MKVVKVEKEYGEWLKELKSKVRNVQFKIAVSANTEVLNFYWSLGADMVRKQFAVAWGDGFISQLSKDLMSEFPEMKGFSVSNLKFMRQWYLFYKQEEISLQVVSQLENKKRQQLVVQIPWGQNIAIITKCKNVEEALFYVRCTLKNGWSRSVLSHQIESGLYDRQGKSLSNFDLTLPSVQSDLAKETLKNPYLFDFITLREKYDEKEFEHELVNQVTKFLMELGSGFSFLGRQYKFEIEGDEFFIDLLFYHVRLHCYFVVELKTSKFKPEYSGKLNFYISAIDGLLKSEKDNPTIGIIICKSKNNIVVEYSLKNMNTPIGVSEYMLTKNLPERFKSSLPTIEEIESELEK